MRYSLSLSCAAATLLASVSLGWAQVPVTKRCTVSVGEPGANEIRFRIPADSFDLPAPKGLWVSAGGLNGGLEFKFVSTVSGQSPPFVVVSPSSGVTPAWVWVGLDREVVPYLAARPYGIGMRFSPVDEPDKFCSNSAGVIGLDVIPGPPPALTSVVNAATLQADFSPGTIISILGTNLSTPPITARPDAAGLYPTALGNTTVSLNGKPVPLLYVSRERIDAVIPHSIAGETAQDLVVRHNDMESRASRMALHVTSPGIFTASASGGGLGIYNQDGTPNGEDHAAPKGTEIQIRATGAGVWNRSLPDGSIALSSVFFPHYLRPLYEEVILRPQAPVSLMIGGQPAKIWSAGPVPYEVFGTLNIVAVVPEGIASGAQPVVLTIGENSNLNQQVMVVVQ